MLSHRLRAGHLDTRLPMSRESLERAAHAGLQDSMPRAAVLSAHARVEGVGPFAWEEPPFIQTWGPRFNVYVIAERDRAIFTLGRLSRSPDAEKKANDVANRFEDAVGRAPVRMNEVGKLIGAHHNYLRYGAPTGRLQIRWDGAGDTTVWAVDAPDADPDEARLELARRYLHILGPGTGEGFGEWAGIRAPRAMATIDELAGETVTTRLGDDEGVILSSDEDSFRKGETEPHGVRLLPSGDSYWLLHGKPRELLVPDPGRLPELWTPRVWPGAILVRSEIAGVWRRSGTAVTLVPWQPFAPDDIAAVEEEAQSLPLPDPGREMRVSWSES